MSEIVEQKLFHAPKVEDDADNEDDKEDDKDKDDKDKDYKDEDDKEGEKGEEELDSDPPAVIETITMKEEDRLAAVVAEIDNDALLVPRSAFVLTVEGHVEENRFFCGLSTADATELGSFCHFRPARLSIMKRVRRADFDPSVEFLDTAGDDIPEGVWRFQYERGGALVFLRNFLWPGYAFYHLPGTVHYGSLYMGDGLFNIDFPYMI